MSTLKSLVENWTSLFQRNSKT